MSDSPEPSDEAAPEPVPAPSDPPDSDVSPFDVPTFDKIDAGLPSGGVDIET